MTARLGVVVLGLLLAGCLGQQPDDADAASPSGLFVADEDGLRATGPLPGFAIESPVLFKATVDLMGYIEPDSAIILLYQALEPQTVDLGIEQSVLVEVGPDLGLAESSRDGDFCVFSMLEVLVPGDAYLARATGQEGHMEEIGYDRQFYWQKMAGSKSLVFGDVGSSGSPSLSAELSAGEWALFVGAQSGISATEFNDGENELDLTVDSDGAGRLVLLRTPTTFLCGIGFGRFGGTSAGSVYSGGALATEGRYGTTATFSADSLAVNLVENRATLTFLEDTIPVTDLSSEWRFAYEAGPAALEIDHWEGEPTWLLAGLSIPVPGPGCPDHCPPAGRARPAAH
jgi:hypothetical protein